MVRKSSRCQTYKIVSSSSDTTTSSSEYSDSPLKKFNRLLRSSVARQWAYFKKDRHHARGRSVSDAGLCSIADHVPELAYLDIPSRRMRVLGTRSTSALDRCDGEVPTFFISSAGGGHVGIEEASDGSDVERPRRNHLRVPSPAFVGQQRMEGLERKKVEDMNVTSLWDHKEMTLECEEKIESPNVMPDSREFVALGCKKLKQVNFESDSKDVRLKSKNVMSRTKDLTQGVKITEESKVVTPESKTVDVRKYVKLGSKSVSFGTDRAIDENKKQTKECIVEKPESKDLTSEKNKVTVVKSKEVTPESKNVVTESQDVKLDDKNKNATSENKKNVMESKCVKSERKNVVSKSKYVTTEVKNLNNQSCFKSESKNRMSEIESKALKSENKDVKSENKDLGSGKLFKWSIRRDSLPLVSIRNALLKRRNLSPDNLIWRRRSTGNFAAGSAGGGREIPRSAPATPLQFEPTPTPRNIKNEKQAIKPLSGSAISVRATGPTNGTGDAKESKQPSKSRQKKFQRHFPQVGPEEKVLNYYSCALVGDLLLQGHLYITKNYFAFYSNVFGYVTKLLIPTISVLRITKEKVARIIPNAVGVCTRDERHVFGSLLSRDSTYKLMTHVWKAARAPETLPPKQDLRASEVELDASEYSPEDDSSSAGDRLDAPEPPVIRREPETLIGVAGASAILQPKLIVKPAQEPGSTHYQALLISIAVLLAISASWMCYQLYLTRHPPIQDDLSKLSGEELYSELVRFRARLHGRAANELHTFLSSNLLLLSKVRQSLEALSGVILTDMAREIPGDSVFS